MKKVEDKLNEILDITPKVEVEKVNSVIPRPKEDQDITNDYKYSRENLYNLIERGTDGLEELSKEDKTQLTVY